VLEAPADLIAGQRAVTAWDNHEGDGRVTFQQWDGEKWKVISGWIAPDWQLLRPIIEKSSEAYAKEKGIKVRTSDSAAN
jgi:branched-chain amino acid transport system substrate-binding protein